MKKTQLLAQVFKAFVENRINCSDWKRLSAAIEKAFIDDLINLVNRENSAQDKQIYQNLQASGLTEIAERAFVSNPNDQRGAGVFCGGVANLWEGDDE